MSSSSSSSSSSSKSGGGAGGGAGAGAGAAASGGGDASNHVTAASSSYAGHSASGGERSTSMPSSSQHAGRSGTSRTAFGSSGRYLHSSNLSPRSIPGTPGPGSFRSTPAIGAGGGSRAAASGAAAAAGGGRHRHHDDDDASAGAADWRVALNVGGRRFETFASTLRSFPDTLLGAMFNSRNSRMLLADGAGEFFFDRDPDAFAVVLNFYRTQKLIIPPGVPEDLVLEELKYFQLPLKEEEQGHVFTWGGGPFGQLGHGDRRTLMLPQPVEALQNKHIIQVSLGTSHSAALSDTGVVFTWGYGGDGRLGHGDVNDQLIPKRVEALKGTTITQVVCGELHTAALTEDGGLFTWGLGKDGRLGHRNTDSSLVPLKVKELEQYCIVEAACGGLHTAALTDKGQVLTWGRGKDGRLGHGDQEDQLTPKAVAELADKVIAQVACGGHHSAAHCVDGQVYTWGYDDDGRLGHGAVGHMFTPKVVEGLSGVHVVSVACGCWHTAALSDEGAVYTWGSCKSGQLGQGHKQTLTAPRVVLQGKGGGIRAIACGTAHTAALTESGDVYTWGKHDECRLGYPATTDQTTPKLVEALKDIKIRQVVCGVYDTAALTFDRSTAFPSSRPSSTVTTSTTSTFHK